MFDRLQYYLPWLIVLAAIGSVLSFAFRLIDAQTLLPVVALLIGLLPVGMSYRQSVFQERLMQLVTNLTPSQYALMKALHKKGSLDIDTLSGIAGINRTEVLSALGELEQRKLVTSREFKEGKTRYRLSAQGRITVTPYSLSKTAGNQD